MGRLIEIQSIQDLPPSLAISTGDILVFEASGGHVRSGAEVVELLGIFLSSVMGDNQQVLSPMGAPNAVVFLARCPGSAKIDVIIGDPWNNLKTVPLELIVSR
jgi:hypothetical protein